MNTLEFHRIVQLLDLYGSFLTKKQLHIMKERYLDDYSLSEIAELLKISRSAVQYTIHQAVDKLETFEENLHLLENYTQRKKTLEALENTNLTDEQKILIETLKQVM